MFFNHTFVSLILGIIVSRKLSANVTTKYEKSDSKFGLKNLIRKDNLPMVYEPDEILLYVLSYTNHVGNSSTL